MVESKFQTSFIPKKPIETGSSERRSHAPSLFRLIAIVIFLLSLVAWGGLFLWKAYVSNQIQEATQSLQASQKEFDLNTVNTLTRLDNRLSAGENILNNHTALSKLFVELQDMTLKNVQFTSFNLSSAGATNGLVLNLKGRAANYATVARQSDYFSQSPDFHSPIFSNLDLDQTGQVVFSVTTNIDPHAFLYKNGSSLTTTQ